MKAHAQPRAFSVRILVVLGTTVCLSVTHANTRVIVWGATTSAQTNIPAGLTNVVTVTAGLVSSLALKEDGTVAMWGVPTFTPAGLTNIVALAEGSSPAFGLRSDGTLASWLPLPTLPSDLGRLVSVAAGASHEVGLRTDGTVIAWGDNHFGQTNVPVGLGNVIGLAAGGEHTLALKADGTVVAWGSNAYGETNVPAGLTSVIAVAAGTNHSLALRSDGTVVAWGDNSYGQTTVPAGLTNVVRIAAGDNVSLALRSDGTLVAWGDNTFGQTTLPVNLTNVLSMAVGAEYCLAVEGSLPPFFNAASAPRTLLMGRDVYFQLPVLGCWPFSYQWTFNGTNLPGATTTVLALSSLGSGEEGTYALVASNSLGRAISPNIVLHVTQIAAWGSDQWQQLELPAGLTNVVEIAAGAVFSLALKSDHTVVAWGANFSGETNVPAGLTNVIAIAGGNGQGMALRSDGTVVVWGNNISGQTNVPAGLSNVVAIAGGYTYCTALRSDGTVVSWGSSPAPPPLTNLVGVAASKVTAVLSAAETISDWGVDLSALLDVPGDLTNAVQLAGSVGVSTAHTLALRADGTVASWGYGQSPVPSSLTDVISVAAGEQQDLAVTADGRAVLWCGRDSAASNPPSTLTNIVQVAAGSFHALALIGNGPPFLTSPMVNRSSPYGLPAALFASATGSWPLHFQWRFNGQDLPGATNPILTFPSLGFEQDGLYSVVVSNADGSIIGPQMKLQVAPLLITSPPANLFLPEGMNGSLSVGAVGLGLSYQWQFKGVSLPGQTNATLNVTDIQPAQSGTYTVIIQNSVGRVTSLPAMIQVSQVAAWGDGVTDQTNVPPGLTNLLAIAAGRSHNLALMTNGTVVGWGSDSFGESDSPRGLSNVIALAAGAYHNLALLADNTVLAWGDNSFGQTNVPPGLTNVVAVSAGYAHSLALTADGRVVAWGDDATGQTNVPPGLNNVVAIAAGNSHNLALKSDGTVVVWGDNSMAELDMPAGLTNVDRIAAGDFHSLALEADGTVVAWGSAETGAPISTPPVLTNVAAIAGGAHHDLALLADGTVVGWGDNTYGQLSLPPELTNCFAIAAGYYHSLALIGSVPRLTVTPRLSVSGNGTSLSLSLPTRSGRAYALEYTDSLISPSWTSFPLVAGNGRVLVLTAPAGPVSQRFYRVREW